MPPTIGRARRSRTRIRRTAARRHGRCRRSRQRRNRPPEAVLVGAACPHGPLRAGWEPCLGAGRRPPLPPPLRCGGPGRPNPAGAPARSRGPANGAPVVYGATSGQAECTACGERSRAARSVSVPHPASECERIRQPTERKRRKMDKFNELTTGAKLVLGATVAFLIVSFFE